MSSVSLKLTDFINTLYFLILMALPTTGPISFAQLRDEFSDTNPVSIAEFYRGGGLVGDNSINQAVPTSGEIAITDFYGASDSVITKSITQDTEAVSLNLLFNQAELQSGSDLVVMIQAGVTVYGSELSAALSYFPFPGAQPPITVMNQGFIIGYGGQKGITQNGVDGKGGPAISAVLPLFIDNQGVIAGGGGAGGDGGTGGIGDCGAGNPDANGGLGGDGGRGRSYLPALDGDDGTGSTTSCQNGGDGGKGGFGGDWGLPGTPGGPGFPGIGGAPGTQGLPGRPAGNVLTGFSVSNVTFIEEGFLRGEDYP